MATGTNAPLRRRRPGRPAGGQAGEGQEALLRAARELLAEKGLPGVTMREVADRAGGQPALVNYYFGGKQGLLRAVVAGLASQILERVAEGAASGGSVEERFRAVLRSLVAFWVEEPYAPRLVMEQVLFGEEETIDEFVDGYARKNLEMIRGLLEAGEASGEIRHVEPLYAIPSTLGGCIFFFLSAPVILRLFQLDRITPELAQELADHTVRTLFHGISARPGEAP